MNRLFASTEIYLRMAKQKELPGEAVPKSRKQGKKASLEAPVADVSLSFNTQRLRALKSAAPIASLLTASPLEELSFQQTIAVKPKNSAASFLNGETIATKIGQMDYNKSQAVMLISASGVGLLIGLFIAYFI